MSIRNSKDFNNQFNTNQTKIQTMSAQARSQIKRTPFCKFCKDIGKSQEIYQSHYPKDRPGPNGKVVCPEILAKNKRQWAMRRQPRGGDSRSNFRRQPYQRSRQFRPKVEPKNSIANWGMVNNKKFKDTISRAGRSGQIVERSTSNKFAALNEEDECRVEIVGPKVCKPKSVTGSWGKQLVIEASDEPVKFKSLKEISEEKEDAMYEAEIEEKQSSMVELSTNYDIVNGNWGDMAMEEDEDDDGIIEEQYHGTVESVTLDGWYD
jgi:hypothetical protein